MLNDHRDPFFERAAVASLERIRFDRARAPERLKPVFAYIERHLFEPTLTVERLKEALGVRDNSFSTVVGDACGRTPRVYIENRRCETGCRLLAAEDLTVRQISQRLGFSNPRRFTRAFQRWAGQSPSAYREQARKGLAQDLTDPELWRRALAGELPAAEASVLMERLWRVYRNTVLLPGAERC